MIASAPVPPAAPPRPLAGLGAWLGVALVYALLMTAAALWGLKAGERGIDTRAQALLACYAFGSPLGFLALAPVYRFVLPRRWPLLRYAVAFVLVLGASAAAIALLAFIVTNPFMDVLDPDLSLVHRVRSVVEPYAVQVALFLTLGLRLALPQALLPLCLAAFWLGRRRMRD